MSDEPTYWDSVKMLAKGILQSLEGGEFEADDMPDIISEEVSSNGWIVWYGENEEVLKCTNNYPDDRDVYELIDAEKGADWREVRRHSAFKAMCGDVQDKIKGLQEEKEEECD